MAGCTCPIQGTQQSKNFTASNTFVVAIAGQSGAGKSTVEEPFGRERDALHDLIDFVVYIDLPWDVAHARKLARKREFLPWEDDPDIFIANLRQNLEWYLSIGREFYLAIASRVRQNCDLVVDGMPPTEIITNQIFKPINGR